MTPTQAKQLNESPVWKAFMEGETIQWFYRDCNRWEDMQMISVEDLLEFPERYRIKPEKKELWAVFTPNGSYAACFTEEKEATYTAERISGIVVHMVEKD